MIRGKVFRNGLRAGVRLCSNSAQVAEVGGAAWSLNFSTDNVFTHNMKFKDGKESYEPLFSILNQNGTLADTAVDPEIGKDLARNMMTNMLKLQAMDKILYDSQRQGTISFYMTQTGEEAAVIGTAAALDALDLVYGQYREFGLLIYRGFSFQDLISQCMGNQNDRQKGRQMPIHYGSPELAFQTISSPLATQIPHSSGAGYAYRLQDNDKITVCFFGEGAASEGDFHAGLNFASTLKARTLFYCRNNGYAISTPTNEQYGGDGIFARGPAYGIPSVRVDGNDILAVYSAVKEARRIIMEQDTPVLIESMTYRIGHHSTSDDSSRYRPKTETDFWAEALSPINRFGKYLENKGWWTQAESDEIKKSVRSEIIEQLNIQKKVPLRPVSSMFDDVYAAPTHIIEAQQADLNAHLEEFGDNEFYKGH